VYSKNKGNMFQDKLQACRQIT